MTTLLCSLGIFFGMISTFYGFANIDREYYWILAGGGFILTVFCAIFLTTTWVM